MQEWHLYLIRTRRGELYTGVATDVARRLSEHAGSGPKGSKFLRSKGPLELAYAARIGSRSLALRAEHRVKILSKESKESIVAASPEGRELLEILEIDPGLRRAVPLGRDSTDQGTET